MSEAIKALVVIPTYNEADNIERLCKALCENPRVARVLVVDDNSPDGTADKAETLTGDYPVTVLRREKKNGRGGAVLDDAELTTTPSPFGRRLRGSGHRPRRRPGRGGPEGRGRG